ncbi:hypothetical protein P171DRAFT_364894 [Karstenula rhodostoma CBS 690.94]|uniref:Cell wall protein n=1 Tax=Karstenula rhodostoma CBS 690.94 TaxID=1392251 RepID=A0A9P4U9H1_9PLEO|nr:hypothetical protein P171DRAFT_364894 [Karstenula rhodostoma CBS 690.94]
MPSSKVMLTLDLLTVAYALPTPQLAGDGAAANSLLSSTNNGVGYGIENAEDNLATSVKSSNAEDNTAALVTSVKGSVPVRRTRRQLDKVSNGAHTLSNAVGTGAVTSSLTGELDTIDGQSTSGAANLGAQVGNVKASTLESAGSLTPKCQLDKISGVAQMLSNAVGTGAATSATTGAWTTSMGH